MEDLSYAHSKEFQKKLEEKAKEEREKEERERTRWIPRRPPYKDVTEWYCRCCDKWTKIMFNPEWEKDGKPTEWKGKDYEWFVCCKKCGDKYYSGFEYYCPKCGWDAFPDDPPFDRYIIEKGRITRKNKVVVIPCFLVERDEDGNEHLVYEKDKRGMSTPVENKEYLEKIRSKYKIYPVIENYHYESNYMGAFHSWDETHFCPRHGEFTFNNGT